MDEVQGLRRGRPDWTFTGVDPSREMLALATRVLGHLAPRVDLVEGDIDAAPDLAFHGATCLLTLHVLSREARLHALRALKRRF